MSAILQIAQTLHAPEGWRVQGLQALHANGLILQIRPQDRAPDLFYLDMLQTSYQPFADGMLFEEDIDPGRACVYPAQHPVQVNLWKTTRPLWIGAVRMPVLSSQAFQQAWFAQMGLGCWQRLHALQVLLGCVPDIAQWRYDDDTSVADSFLTHQGKTIVLDLPLWQILQRDHLCLLSDHPFLNTPSYLLAKPPVSRHALLQTLSFVENWDPEILQIFQRTGAQF